MISMCGLAGGGGPTEGSVVSGVWAPAGASVKSASGRPSDNPSATQSRVLIGFPPCVVTPSSESNEGRGAPPVRDKPYYAHRRCRCTARFRPPDTALGSAILPHDGFSFGIERVKFGHAVSHKTS